MGQDGGARAAREVEQGGQQARQFGVVQFRHGGAFLVFESGGL
jgi:hypothetical protein